MAFVSQTFLYSHIPIFQQDIDFMFGDAWN